MRKNKLVVAFDIGSSKLRAMVAGDGLNDTINVKGYKELDYEGFYEGNFLNKEKLPSLLEQLTRELDVFSSKIDKVFIGVPAEFSSVKRTDVSIHFGDRRKVKKQDIDSLYYMASEKSKNNEAMIVSVNAISFVLDDGRLTMNPVGESALSITAKLSIVYANKEFIELFNNIVAGLNFSSVEYISEPLSDALYLIPKEQREDLSLLIDVGDLTTTVAFVKGDGLYELTSFSRGGGFITNDLSEAFDLSFQEADRLKKEIVLSLKGKQKDFYELNTDAGKVTKIMLNSANEVVSYRIEEMAQVINKCIQKTTREYVNYLPVYLCGAGISKIKGGKDFLAKCLVRNIAFALPPLPGKDKPENASVFSLVKQALLTNNEK